uniref:glutathione transferase n=1 Tax=Cipangopaludina cathayensis TaxID=570432 RepID=D3TJN9_9CAEN|nr:pi-class glutathione S-transferase [Cipangopaludina cathayensis]
MTGYKLLYFTVRGRGEAIRLLLAENGIEFEEASPTPWPEYKPKMPFGQVPCFYDGDFQLVQSNAILRYLARKHDLYGSSLQSQAKIDMLNDGVEDVRNTYVKLIYQNYEAGKEEYIKNLPNALQPFENLLTASDAGVTGASVDGKRSFVDYNLFDLLDIRCVLAPNCLSEFPPLKAFYDKIASDPKISAYRQTEGFKTRSINGNGKQ